jgi:hypothetical protein
MEKFSQFHGRDGKFQKKSSEEEGGGGGEDWETVRRKEATRNQSVG